MLLSVLCFTLVAGVLQAQAIENNWAERFPSGMTPQLEKALSEMPRGGTLDVYAVMKKRLTSNALKDLTRGVARSDRHGVVADALRSFAAVSQKTVRDTLAARDSAAAREPVRMLWISNAVRFTATADEIVAVRGLPGVGSLGVIRDFPAESYQDAGAAATLPFYDGFETGIFGPDWATAVTGAGRIQITTGNTPNGVTFHQALVNGDSIYAQKTIDLDQAAASAGISLTGNFKIRFSWRDNFSIPTDGFAFDEITIDVGDPPPPPTPEPNIDKLQAPQCWAIGVDGDGYIDDIRGWDFESNDNDPYPSSYHGTATAGIVCGDGTDGAITGMAPDATMAIAKIGGEADYWEAQQYAVLIGATTITSSYSYKWGIHDPDYHMFRQNCDMELAAGVIHANSIGNQGDQTGSFPIPFNISAPGNCPGPWVHADQVEGGVSSTLGCAGVNLDESLYTPSGQGGRT